MPVKMNIEAKLLTAFMLFIMITVAIGTFAVYKIAREDRVVEDLAGKAVAGVRAVASVDDMVTSFRRGELLLAISQDADGKEKYIKRMTDDAEQLKVRCAEYEKFIDSPEERKSFDEFTHNWQLFLAEHPRIVELARQSRIPEADAAIRGNSSKYFNLAIKALKANEDAQLTAAQEESKTLLATNRTVKIWIVVSMILAVLLGGVFGVAVAKRISAPLKHLVVKAGCVAAGDMTVRIDHETDDEVGELSDAFNSMLTSLKEIIGTIVDLSAQVAAAAEQLRSEALQMVSDSDQVVTQTNTIATASEEMSATSGDIARNCELAADNSRAANEAALSGSVIIKAAVDGMNRIAECVRQSAATVELLGERSNQIGTIIGTIEDIADQTNLLALNAAIEAARAGEQGRGFAVVADEVRALAERTTKATREIGDMIMTIQLETKNAVLTMEEGVAEVGRGTADAARSGEALRNILGKIEGVTSQVNQIATAAEHQTATTGQISQNLLQVNSAVNDTTRGARETAQAASRLAGAAAELKSLVKRFKI